MTTKSIEKRKHILSCAEQVFIRDGFNGVTMKDIVEECNISRGGLYIYFTSVDDIFLAVIKEHNKDKLEQIQSNVLSGKCFQELLDDFFSYNKNRLLHMEKSLLTATFEFFLSHKNKFDKDFFFTQFYNSKEIVLEILNFGVEHNEISNKDIELLSENIMFFIEGISTLAMSSGVTEGLIDKQFNFIKKQIYRN